MRYLVIALVIMIAILTPTAILTTTMADAYNNGIHNNCGGQWNYVETIAVNARRHLEKDFYECDKCGETFFSIIKFSQNP